MLDRNIKFENLKEMIKNSAEKFGEEPAFLRDGKGLEDSKKVTYKECQKAYCDADSQSHAENHVHCLSIVFPRVLGSQYMKCCDYTGDSQVLYELKLSGKRNGSHGALVKRSKHNGV